MHQTSNIWAFTWGQCITKSSYILICPQRFLPISKFKVNEPICIGPYNLRTLALFKILLWDLRPQTLCHELVLKKLHINLYQYNGVIGIRLALPSQREGTGTQKKDEPKQDQTTTGQIFYLAFLCPLLVAHDGMIWAPEVLVLWSFWLQRDFFLDLDMLSTHNILLSLAYVSQFWNLRYSLVIDFITSIHHHLKGIQ